MFTYFLKTSTFYRKLHAIFNKRNETKLNEIKLNEKRKNAHAREAAFGTAHFRKIPVKMSS